MSEEEGEWVCDLFFSALIGIGVLVTLKNVPDTLLSMILDSGEMILNQIHVSSQLLPLSSDSRWRADFIYAISLTGLDIIRFIIGFGPSLGILRLRRKVIRKKRRNYWN